MKSTIGYISLLLLVCLSLTQASAQTASSPNIRWLCSTEKARWQELAITNTAAATDTYAIKLDAATMFQTMDGFGGCFNELGWEALLAIPTERREAALKELFSPDGANFNLCRAPIGANDFSLGWYSLDETPDDYEMKHFSIERNREALIPYIKAAMKYQPKLGVWASPWCPPSWMTTNGRYRNGRMKGDAQTLAAYAIYFSKFVQSWRAEGVNLYAIYPQNEMGLNDGVYPQCAWSGADMNVFLRDHLLPQLKRDKVKVEVWLGTITSDKLGDYIDPVLGDAKTAAGITGVGLQYGGQRTMLAAELAAHGGSQDRDGEIQLRVSCAEAFLGDGEARRAAHCGERWAVQERRGLSKPGWLQGAGLCEQNRTGCIGHRGS